MRALFHNPLWHIRTSIMASHDEEASLMYILWDDLFKTEKPFQIFTPIPEDAVDQRRANIHFACGRPEKITDARPTMDSYSIDTNGFAFRNYPTQMQRFDDENDIDNHYLPELEWLLRDELGDLDEICFFDWRAGSVLVACEKTN